MILNEFKYSLITPARDEEEYIEKTIKAVISQTILPIKWVIVSDGSTDHTDEIVCKYATQHDFIDLIRTSSSEERNFGSKAKAVKFGYQRLKHLEYEYIGNLDADISFGNDYYEKIICKFRENERLGIAGGVRYDWYNGKFRKQKCARNSVGGPYQLFRRNCYEDIGGYIPLKYGGIDAVAEIMARWHGWEVESFPEIKLYHFRRTGTATRNILNTRFRDGIMEYMIGYHPLFETLRILRNSMDSPILLGSLMWMCGYVFASIQRYERPVPDDFVKYLRSEQLCRIWSIISNLQNSFVSVKLFLRRFLL